MARKTHTEAQARYDKVNRRVYGFRLHNEIDSDIIAKLASVDSMQGYIKQLIREDLNRTCPGTVTICFGKSSIDILARIADEKGLSVPDLISVIVNEQLVRCHSVPESAPETEREEKQMKTYHIKPEYLDMWEGNDTPSVPDRIITEEQVEEFAREWDKSVPELLEQLIEID